MTTFATLLTVFLAVGAPTAAQQPAQTYYAGPSKVSLPLTRAADGKLFLAATIHGEPATLLIDTGGTQFLDLRMCERAGLQLTDPTEPGYGLGGSLPVKRGAVDMRLGALSIRALPVACIDISAMEAAGARNGARRFSGIIGSELLAVLRARVDYDKLIIELRRPTATSVREEERRRQR